MKPKRGRTYRKRATRTSSNTCEVQKYNEFVAWMRKTGYRSSKKLQLHMFSDTGRGLMTKETINAHDLIIGIPEKLLITPMYVLKTKLGSLIQNCCPQATGAEILAVFLMWEKAIGESSKWFPYLSTLPVTYSTPSFFSSRILPLLPKLLYEQFMEKRKKIKCSYMKLRPVFNTLQNTHPAYKSISTFECFRWALTSVDTRCVYKPCDSCHSNQCSHHLALAPYLDFLNHSSCVKVEAGFNRETKLYEIRSCQKFKKYSQVFIHYGNHDNETLLLEYGFVLPDNEYDSVQVSTEDILSTYKSVCGKQLDIEKQNFLSEKELLRNMGIYRDRLTWNLEIVLKILCSGDGVGFWDGVIFDNRPLTGKSKNKFIGLFKEMLALKERNYEIPCNTSCASTLDTEHLELIFRFLYFKKEILLQIQSLMVQ